MRTFQQAGGVSVQAIAGTYVVLLGMDMAAERVPGLLGFAIEREDRTENERYFLNGFKVFAETGAHLPPGRLVSTRKHPVQAFLWGDYTAKPDHRYVYRVHPVYGSPAKPALAAPVTVEVTTENPEIGSHAVFFNRGASASQAYARKFANAHPKDVPDRAAWIWLSRGLEEAILAFIDETGPGQTLHGAFYEFRHAAVLDAFKRAAGRGVTVAIVYDGRNTGVRGANEQAIAAAGIGVLCRARAANPSYISHNKFMVRLSADGQPRAVWTGSTNLTEGGIFGHANVGHRVTDPCVAATFDAYWQRLNGDQLAADLRRWTSANPVSPAVTPLVPPAPGTTAFFSPRKGLNQLEWYAQMMDTARHGIFLTAAFGINDRLESVVGQQRDYLRYLLLEKTDTHEIEVLRRDPDNRFAVGGLITRPGKGRWSPEALTGLNRNVNYIHTKYLLIDPLGADPIVISGSANFSDASTRNNDENMLVIRGDTRVADIYLGEFMRLFQHLAFRDCFKDYEDDPEPAATGTGAATDERLHLAPDDRWARAYFVPDSSRAKERILFGTPAGA